MPAKPTPLNDSKLFQLMAQSVRDYAIFLLDPQGNIQSWNPGAELIKQYKADEIIGKHFSVFYTQEDIARRWPATELQRATSSRWRNHRSARRCACAARGRPGTSPPT